MTDQAVPLPLLLWLVEIESLSKKVKKLKKTKIQKIDNSAQKTNFTYPEDRRLARVGEIRGEVGPDGHKDQNMLKKDVNSFPGFELPFSV